MTTDTSNLTPYNDKKEDPNERSSYLLPRSNTNLNPVERADYNGNEQAANMIRDKIKRLYGEEPAAMEEAKEAEEVLSRSKHQQFMHQLTTLGLNLAEIQTKWHEYYISLPDNEKHEVWQEFYASNTNRFPIKIQETQKSSKQPEQIINDPQTLAEHKHQVTSHAKHSRPASPPIRDDREPQAIRQKILEAVTAHGKLKAKHHFQSLLFGLGLGSIIIFVFLFGFFNQVIIAPFIQPSRIVTATPVIIGTNNLTATSKPEVIIPKINVQIPVNYTVKTTDEYVIETDLENGVVHYPTTVMPGQLGNAAFFGHSSNNILNPGHYKFAFVLLHTLVPGDTFYLTYNSHLYVYKVISRHIVNPNDVGVLGSVPGQIATATLITCDPPGTSLNRLVVVGQQISPNPSNNTAPTQQLAATPATNPGNNLPGNGPLLSLKAFDTTTAKIILAALILLIIGLITRWLYKAKKSF